MLVHGPVRVPKNARKGKAKIVLELSVGNGYQSRATTLEVELK